MSVQFDEENQYQFAPRYVQEKVSGLVNLTIKFGLASDKDEALKVFLYTICIATIATLFILYGTFNDSRPEEPTTRDKAIMEMMRESSLNKRYVR